MSLADALAGALFNVRRIYWPTGEPGLSQAADQILRDPAFRAALEAELAEGLCAKGIGCPYDAAWHPIKHDVDWHDLQAAALTDHLLGGRP